MILLRNLAGGRATGMFVAFGLVIDGSGILVGSGLGLGVVYQERREWECGVLGMASVWRPSIRIIEVRRYCT